MLIKFITFLCVLGMASGQILFKITANSANLAGTYFNIKTLSYLSFSLFIYGVTTFAWIWVLQKSDLGKAYPFMALAFILVPLVSHFIFKEEFTKQYFVGILFIFIGVVLTNQS